MTKQLVAICFCWVSAVDVGWSDATISYDDHVGVPNAGAYPPGQAFSFDLSVTATSTGTQPLDSIAGFTLFFATGVTSSGMFTITNEMLPASTPFTEPNSTLAPGGEVVTTSPNPFGDRGAFQPTPPGWLGPQGVPTNSTYFVASFTIQINSAAPPGLYSIFDYNTGEPIPYSGAWSGQSSPSGPLDNNPAAFPETHYFITVVPEPATWTLCALGGALVGVGIRRRIR